MPSKPLVVYLDTQDYLNLFYEQGSGPSQEVLDQLIEFRDRGEIVIGFSFATIMEVITKPNDEYREERVRRGQLIKDVCGPNAFPYLTDLAKGAAFPNDGHWMLSGSERAFSAKKFKRDMHKALLEQVAKAKGLNRQQRRSLGRKASMVDLIRKTGSTWGRKRSDYGDFPVSDELVESRILERFMKGQCTDREFETRMNAWFSDPAEFSRIAYDYADKPNMIDELFGDAADRFEHLVETIREAQLSFQKLNEAKLNSRQILLKAGMGKTEARRLTKQVALQKPDLDTSHKKLEEAFGKERVGHFDHYLAHLMRPGYSFKRSDIMDIMQMCYAYDCDLFRCDKDMANTFRDYDPFKGKLVSRFSELPSRIVAALEQRKQQTDERFEAIDDPQTSA